MAMALVNLPLAIVGLLGFFLWQSLTNTTGTSTNDTLLANLAIGLEVAADGRRFPGELAAIPACRVGRP